MDLDEQLMHVTLVKLMCDGHTRAPDGVKESVPGLNRGTGSMSSRFIGFFADLTFCPLAQSKKRKGSGGTRE